MQALFSNARIVHRLDMSTSGLIVMAKGLEVLRHLSRQFQKRQVNKTYTAEVWGQVEGEEGVIDLPLACDWPNRPRQEVNFERGRAAITRWQVAARTSEATRMILFPETGRSHQLRVHMKELGHPIIGDEFYAEGEALAASPRLALHATELSFHHPDGGAMVHFKDAPSF